MTEKLEGTMRLDGLIEGRLTDADEAERHIRHWIRAAAESDVRLSFDTDGATFSILAEDTPFVPAKLGVDPTRGMTALLERLLEDLSPETRASMSSTLRSVHYRPGEEVQTLYGILPPGRIDCHQRVVDADTTRPPEPMTRKEKVRFATVTLLVIVGVFGVTALFVPYGDIARGLAERVTPFNPDELIIDSAVFADYFDILEVKVGDRRRSVVITIRRTARFPVTTSDAESLLRGVEGAHTTRLAAEAVVRGYLRCELFDKEGTFFRFADVRIAGLREAEELSVSIPLHPNHRLARVVFTH